MPFIVHAGEGRSEPVGDGATLTWVIAPGHLPDDRLRVAVAELSPGAAVPIEPGPDGLAWVQLLDGEAQLGEHGLTVDSIAMLARGTRADLVAQTAVRALVCVSTRAATDDPALAPGIVVRDWTTEPVLRADHDPRTRVYLATPGLWGTAAVRGEMITYPPGASGGAHHHEGAEHFQFVLRGSGTAVLDGVEFPLAAGDLLYNLERELHWFRTDADATEDMVFVEYFVPGESRTVWAPDANVCGWSPTGHDVRGREPARTLSAHIHGQGDV